MKHDRLRNGDRVTVYLGYRHYTGVVFSYWYGDATILVTEDGYDRPEICWLHQVLKSP
jgi:hypothetical protein